MKIVVTGDRQWDDQPAIERAFDILKVTHLVEGECRGADLLARAVAEERGVPVSKFPANWDEYGKAAGHLRNLVMLDQNPDLVLALHDSLFEKSKGTRHCVTRALERGLDVLLVSHRATDRTVSIRRLTHVDLARLKRRGST